MLTGCTSLGSIPIAVVYPIAFLFLVFGQIVLNRLSTLTGITNRSEEVSYMATNNRRLRLLCFSIINTVWAIGTSTVAGALPT